MDVKEAIEKRKSIRAYQARDVPKEIVLELIDAARLAPTGKNIQPLRIKVLGKATIERLKQAQVFPQEFVYTAPVILICYGNPDVYLEKYPDSTYEQNVLRTMRDISIQTAFLMLRATELGLGSCYIGRMDKEKAKELLGIPKSYVLAYAITLGYPAEEGRPRARLELEELYEELP
ncbi:nitroreductase [Candidatus Woesearchaeota archaeon]|nr:nitroreductase family protein [Candidatus Woesearchaeota archaeon]RLE42519.1 MAG: nitroreductase [Candidatus Woesearchaeota archaeon]